MGVLTTDGGSPDGARPLTDSSASRFIIHCRQCSKLVAAFTSPFRIQIWFAVWCAA